MADLAVAGPMARSIDDLKLGLDIMAGPNRWESPAWRLKLPRRGAEAEEYRIAAWLDDPVAAWSPSCASSGKGGARLADEGVRVDYEARPRSPWKKWPIRSPRCFRRRWPAESTRDRIERLCGHDGDTPAAHTRRLLAMRHREWLSHNERRLQMRKRWEEFFTKWDAILLPVMPCPAIPHDHSEPMASRTAMSGVSSGPTGI